MGIAAGNGGGNKAITLVQILQETVTRAFGVGQVKRQLQGSQVGALGGVVVEINFLGPPALLEINHSIAGPGSHGAENHQTDPGPQGEQPPPHKPPTGLEGYRMHWHGGSPEEQLNPQVCSRSDGVKSSIPTQSLQARLSTAMGSHASHGSTRSSAASAQLTNKPNAKIRSG
jgi:hypothetical protein